MNAAPDRPDLDRQVDEVQTEMTFDRSRTSNLLGVPVGLMICALLWTAVDQLSLVLWLLAKTASSGWRAWIGQRFDAERPARVLHWGRLFTAALAIDGFIYGLLGTVLLPRANAVLALVMVATLLGISAIGLVVLSMSQRASLALIVPLLLPPMCWQLLQGDAVSLYIGVGMAVFLGLTVVEGQRASKHTRAMLALRFSTAELAAQRQQALAQAERSSAVKGQFLAVMSHEMRTPLHGILGLARLLRHDEADSDQASSPQLRHERLLTLEHTGEHLLGIINDVLDYSKIEGQHLRLVHTSFELNALLETVADLVRVSAHEKGLWLRVEQNLPQPCWVQGDPARLRQVLLNLAGNAVKFTDAGGVTLSSTRGETADNSPGGPYRFALRDSGPGVPESDRERIFQPFEQLDGSFSRRHGGTGLGLTISRELVRAMGGDLQCLPAPEGGALFVACLPLPAVPAPTPVVQPSTDRPRLRGKVLLAEDNPVNAIVAEAVLHRLGLTVQLVTDGHQAVAQATAGGADLVLMDCQMPGLDGFEATARIRLHEQQKVLRRVPIVALTANALEGDRERSLAAGMDEHLAKPFDEADLVATLRRFLPA